MKYIFIHNSGWNFMKVFEDLRPFQDVKLKALSSIDNWRVGFYGKIHKELPPPHYFLWRFNFSKERHVFILEHQVLLLWGISWINKLKEQYGNRVIFVLTLYDSMNAASPSLTAAKESISKIKWDLIYSFDREDVEHYGWKWLGYSYFSSYFKKTNNIGTAIDAYFVGGLKGGRTQLIMDIATVFEKEHIDYLFELLPGKENVGDLCRYPHIHYLDRVVKYHFIQKYLPNTNCIIEILQKNQHSQSFRYFEAIYYNKKLLTNNQDVIHYPFYNPEYIKVFKNAGDIDCDWVRERKHVDYGYNDEFSPIHFLNMIKADTQERVKD